MFRNEPINFSWVDDKLAACGFPGTVGKLRWLHEQGITLLVNLAAEKRVAVEACPGLNCIDIKIRNFGVPTMRQVEDFVQLLNRTREKGDAVAVCCLMGRGRTGVMLACYFLHKNRCSAEEAIRTVRTLRPRSIDSKKQEEFIEVWEKHVLCSSKT